VCFITTQFSSFNYIITGVAPFFTEDGSDQNTWAFILLCNQFRCLARLLTANTYLGLGVDARSAKEISTMPLPKLPPLPTTGIIGKVLLMTNPKLKS